MWRWVGGSLMLAAAVLAAPPPEGDCRAPRLTVEASSSRPRQGGIVAVTLRSDLPLSRAALSDGRRGASMEPDPSANGRIFRALWGIDFESAVGSRRVRVETVGLCGDKRPTRWSVRITGGRFPSQSLEVDPAFVEVPPGEQERVREDRQKVARVWAAGSAPRRRWDGPFRLPVEAPPLPNFGARRVFNEKPRSRHDGVDLAAPSGAPVTAPAEAVVVMAENLFFSGGTVILDHGGGLFTTYFHLSRIDVEVGERVSAADALGSVGATGRATGPHLHWGARLNRARVNPLDLLMLPPWPPESRVRVAAPSRDP